MILLVHCRAATVRTDGATVVVNEVSVLTLKTSIGRVSASERAEALAVKLAAVDSIDSVELRQSRRLCRLVWNGRVLLIISSKEASAQGMSAANLGSAWLKSMRSAWLLAPVQLSQDRATLPVGGHVIVQMIGSAARTAPISLDNGLVADAARNGATITVTAKMVGTVNVGVGEGATAAVMKVQVEPYAAVFPQHFSISLVGSPADPELVKGAIVSQILNHLQAVPGARATLDAIEVGEVQAGERRNVDVKVSTAAPDSFPASGVVSVDVQDLAIPSKREEALWYCNNPEDITKPEALFCSRLTADVPVRMLYHHINQTRSPLLFRVLAINDSDETARLAITPGDSKPDSNPVMAGLDAAAPFFREWLTGAGEVQELPPHRTIPISFHRLGPQETASGLCILRLLDGGPPNVRVVAEAIPPYETDVSWSHALESNTPWREVGAVDVQPLYSEVESKDLYPSPYLREEFEYKVGGNFSFYRLGEHALQGTDGDKPLAGNFGVTYTISARADNPTSNSVDVELVFSDSAGYSGALLSVDGQTVRIDPEDPGKETRLTHFRLNPGKSRTVTVTTIPLSGSSYPATLVLRQVSSF